MTLVAVATGAVVGTIVTVVAVVTVDATVNVAVVTVVAVGCWHCQMEHEGSSESSAGQKIRLIDPVVVEHVKQQKNRNKQQQQQQQQ